MTTKKVKAEAPKAEAKRKPLNKKELGKLIAQFNCAIFNAGSLWGTIGEELALRGAVKGKEKIWNGVSDFSAKATAFLKDKGF